MNQTHRLVGGSTAFVVTTAVGLPPEVVVGAMLGAVAGSSMPDDAEKTLHLPHRKITHWPAVQIATWAGIAALATSQLPRFALIIWCTAAFVVFGCVMHSVADAMTVERNGIKLLWPLSRRGYHLLPWSMRVWVGSKSVSERVFVALWSAFVLIYAYAHFGHLIST